LERACELAVSVYENRTRESGDPYISHAVAVGLIAAKALQRDPHVDVMVVTAALVHDVNYVVGPEALAEVGEALGPETQALVEEASRLGQGIEEQHLDYVVVVRRFGNAAILIRLADRLHNMQTIGSVPRHRWDELVKETEDLYLPLAQKAGYPDIMEELERTSQEAKLCLATAF
jgi:(p)ppGpp synthase/HD superfamily hydrolase